ncbi:MAG: MFS transporter [Sphingomonas sp.]
MGFIGRASVADEARWRAYNRIAWKILPLMLLGYTLANIDRINVAFAKLQMSGAIGLTEATYGFGAGIFFLSYALVEIPSNMILHRVGARLWLSRIMIVWGMVSAATLLVQDAPPFLHRPPRPRRREAGFYPGALLFMTYWFPSHVRAQATSVMLLGSSLASIIGSPLSGAIMGYMNGWLGLAGWQWVFLTEGLPATLLGIVLLVVLRNGPAEAKWLSAEEKALVIADLSAERQAQAGAGMGHRFRDAFRNPNIWCIVVANFCNLSTLYGIQFWLPTIIQKVGGATVFNTGLIASGLALIPCVVLIANARHSDRTRERRWHATCGFLASAAGSQHRGDVQRQRLSGAGGAGAGQFGVRGRIGDDLLAAGDVRDGGGRRGGLRADHHARQPRRLFHALCVRGASRLDGRLQRGLLCDEPGVAGRRGRHPLDAGAAAEQADRGGAGAARGLGSHSAAIYPPSSAMVEPLT